MMRSSLSSLRRLYPRWCVAALVAMLPSFVRAFSGSVRRSVTSRSNNSFLPCRRSAALCSAAAGSEPKGGSTSAVVDAATGHILGGMYGGDYAGLSATFSSSTGSLIRVPDHLVPESMIEWGQVPSCLEILTSEDIVEEEGGAQHLKLERRTVTVVPDVGCGVDNLDTMKSSMSTSADAMSTSADGQSIALDRRHPASGATGQRRTIETTFSLPAETQSGDENVEGDSADGAVTYPRRVRLSFDVESGERKILTPVTVIVERQTAAQSTGGTIADGGGLDGRTVTRLVGRESVNRPFSEKAAPWSAVDLAGAWVRSSFGDSGEGDKVTYGEGDFQSVDGRVFLWLPGDILVLFEEGTGPDKRIWRVEVSHVAAGLTKGDSNESAVSRRVVQRLFDNDGEPTGEAEHWDEHRM